MFLDGCWMCIMHDITYNQERYVNQACFDLTLYFDDQLGH